MVKLVNRILQLAIQDAAVGHYDHGLKDFFIICIVKTGQSMCQPCDGI